MQDKAVATSPSDLMSSCNAGQLPYKERLQRTLTQQDENVVLLLKTTRTISDTAVENVFATQEKGLPLKGHNPDDHDDDDGGDGLTPKGPQPR